MVAMRRLFLLPLLAALSVVACRRGAPTQVAPPDAAAPSAAATPAPAAEPTVVFLGDSLSAGFGVSGEDAFPSVVWKALAADGCGFRLVNAGVSGDTSAGGRARIDWLLRQKPSVVVVELGGNDALRGQPIAGIEANLRTIVRSAKASGAKVLLTGMRIPPSYGPEYAGGFERLYPKLAREEDLAFLPFLLEGVGGDELLNQADGIHPTAEGHRKIAALVAPHLAPLLGCPLPRA
jgi:acyl-CoA thioesterase-1